MGGPALARPALVLYHGLQPRVKPRGAGAPRSTGLGRQGRSRLRTKAILLDPDRGNDAGMSRSVPRADRIGVAGAPPLRCGGICPAAGGDTEGVESRAAPMGAQQSRAATTRGLSDGAHQLKIVDDGRCFRLMEIRAETNDRRLYASLAAATSGTVERHDTSQSRIVNNTHGLDSPFQPTPFDGLPQLVTPEGHPTRSQPRK